MVLKALFPELTESDFLSFHTGNITESCRLNIFRMAYYWYGAGVHDAGGFSVYLWNRNYTAGAESNVAFVGYVLWGMTSPTLYQG